MTKVLDFRSDTVTQPTAAMREAMAAAEVGDDILGDDPTVDALEVKAAEIFGMQAGLFLISGTMSNQVAMMSLTEKGDEVLVGEASHIYNLEVAGLAALAGVQARPLRTRGGMFDLDEVRAAIRSAGIQSPRTRVLCLENTNDLNRGIALTPEYMAEASGLAAGYGLGVYLDGARVFNAAVACGVAPRQLARGADAMMFCLSKGLAAPVGSMLLGSRDFIDKARWMRQMIGGGMRQAGHMAAAGLVALDTMQEQLTRDHANAQQLASGIRSLREDLVEDGCPHTNIVRVDFAHTGWPVRAVVEGLAERGVLVKQVSQTACRMVTHWGIGQSDVAEALDSLGEVVRALPL